MDLIWSLNQSSCGNNIWCHDSLSSLYKLKFTSPVQKSLPGAPHCEDPLHSCGSSWLVVSTSNLRLLHLAWETKVAEKHWRKPIWKKFLVQHWHRYLRNLVSRKIPPNYCSELLLNFHSAKSSVKSGRYGVFKLSSRRKGRMKEDIASQIL